MLATVAGAVLLAGLFNGVLHRVDSGGVQTMWLGGSVAPTPEPKAPLLLAISAVGPEEQAGPFFVRVASNVNRVSIPTRRSYAAQVPSGLTLNTAPPPSEPPAVSHAATARVYAQPVIAPLREEQVTQILREVGWPEEWIAPGLRVSYGESRWQPWVTSWNGCCGGLFQLHIRTWAPYCGITPEQIYDPVENARCALKIRRYEEARGYPPWSNWEVKP